MAGLLFSELHPLSGADESQWVFIHGNLSLAVHDEGDGLTLLCTTCTRLRLHSFVNFEVLLRRFLCNLTDMLSDCCTMVKEPQDSQGFSCIFTFFRSLHSLEIQQRMFCYWAHKILDGLVSAGMWRIWDALCLWGGRLQQNCCVQVRFYLTLAAIAFLKGLTEFLVWQLLPFQVSLIGTGFEENLETRSFQAWRLLNPCKKRIASVQGWRSVELLC